MIIKKQRIKTLKDFFQEDVIFDLEWNVDERIKPNWIYVMAQQTFNLVYDHINHFPVLILDEAHRFNTNRRDQINKRKNKYLLIWISATPYTKEISEEDFLNKYWWTYFDVKIDKIKAKIFLSYHLYHLISPGVEIWNWDRVSLYNLENYYNDVINLVRKILKFKKNLLILTEYIAQLNKIYEKLKDDKLPVFILDWRDNAKQKEEKISQIEKLERFIIVWNEKSVKEWFDLPNLESALLTYPSRWKQALQQALGRVERYYPNKEPWRVDMQIRYRINWIYYRSKWWTERKKIYLEQGYEVYDFNF